VTLRVRSGNVAPMEKRVHPLALATVGGLVIAALGLAAVQLLL
jgi:hypothetical protein